MHSTVSFALTVLNAHFILGESLDQQFHEKLTGDAKHTIDLVYNLNGNIPCKPINPTLTHSVDITALCAHEGIEEKK